MCVWIFEAEIAFNIISKNRNNALKLENADRKIPTIENGIKRRIFLIYSGLPKYKIVNRKNIIIDIARDKNISLAMTPTLFLVFATTLIMIGFY